MLQIKSLLTVNKLPLYCAQANHLSPPDYESFPSDLEQPAVYKLNQSLKNYQTKNLNLIVLENNCFDYLPYIDFFTMRS